MTKIHLLPILFFVMISSVMKSQKEKVIINITYKSQYCGGARPTPEMIAEAEKSKPYANKTMVIISDKFVVDSAKTNVKGQLQIKIKKGTYTIYEAWKYYKTGPDGMDVSKFEKECLKMEWQRHVFRVIKKGKKAVIETGTEITERCPWSAPCANANSVGPIPE